MGRGRSWPDEKKQFLLDNYNKMSYKKIGELIGKSESSVNSTALRMGLSKEPRWTDEQKEFLKENYDKMDTKDLIKILGKTERSIYAMANLLDLEKIWSEEHEDIMRIYYPDTEYSISFIADKVGRDEKDVYNKANRMGLYRFGPIEDYTTKQIEYIEKNYPTKSAVLIGIELNRTAGAIKRQATIRKVKKKKRSKPKKITRGKRSWTRLEDQFILNNVETKHITMIARWLNRNVGSLEKHIRSLDLYSNRLKKYAKGNFFFYYNNDNELNDKIAYCNFWHKSRKVAQIEYYKSLKNKGGSKSGYPRFEATIQQDEQRLRGIN